jgi:Raf kinase inhibitor-like YbhB/YbcL family protein
MKVATVEVSSVVKTFGPTVALGGANLRAYPGEVQAIIGGNGSGKSTLAKVISGVLIPDSGEVSIMGESATTPVEARALGIANVFQEVLVADECSVLDNVYLGSDQLLSSTLTHDEKVARARVLLRELLDYDLDLDVPVGELPLSFKQWITIARALVSDPRVLILDESSAALDFDSTERLFRKMRQLKAEGVTILIVTHRIAELVRIADRATVLRDGVDVGTLEKEEITEARILSLIAGIEREKTAAEQSIPKRQALTPVLRIERARVWSDASPINFAVYPGEIVGVTGLDGQGQADFVRCLAGVQSLVEGRIELLRDRHVHLIENLPSARENRISYVSGDRKKEGIFANLSIFENLVLPIYPEYSTGGPLNLVNRAKLSPIFEWESSKLAVKMGNRQNLITSLSGGNQQKVLIARAFAEKPVVLALNDPARGIDIGAKLDLYRNLRWLAERGAAVVFLSSELEEFLNLCTRVVVFRNGAISSEFEPPYDGHVLLNAMFGRRLAATPFEEGANDNETEVESALAVGAQAAFRPRSVDGRPAARPVPTGAAPKAMLTAAAGEAFLLSCPDILPGSYIPLRFAEENKVSPRLTWSGAPEGTKSFGLSITDPDLPPQFNFPRSFAHWLVYDIPTDARELPEGASGTSRMPGGAKELNSDFVTFKIPGYGRGYGGPWPPDRAHRYVFTLFALMAERLELDPSADLSTFSAAVASRAIATTSFTALYGPARKPLPS